LRHPRDLLKLSDWQHQSVWLKPLDSAEFQVSQSEKAIHRYCQASDLTDILYQFDREYTSLV
jgi:hypothetical protein